MRIYHRRSGTQFFDDIPDRLKRRALGREAEDVVSGHTLALKIVVLRDVGKALAVQPGYFTIDSFRHSFRAEAVDQQHPPADDHRQLLEEEPTAKIYDIARRTGFSSAKQLSSAFCQCYGVSPREYQRSKGK